MHLFFQQNPFRPDATSDLENDAKLALHLVLFLISTQNPDDGTWRGVHVGATLRNTCHALEALHLLGWEVAAGTVEAGIGWLLNLPDIFSLVSEEEEPIRLHPSRFKTLAWLGEFANPQLRRDFEELEEYLDEDGLIRGIMAKQLLATMVYVDCLDHLEKLGALSVLSQERREHALSCIHKSVSLRLEDLRQNTQHSHITTAGDLSYAMDLLFRTRRLSKQDEISRNVLNVLISALEHPESSRPIPSDTLYCAIQLAAHFPEVAEAKEAGRTLIDHLSLLST